MNTLISPSHQVNLTRWCIPKAPCYTIHDVYSVLGLWCWRTWSWMHNEIYKL